MPLKSGKNSFDSNVSELMRSYAKKKKIGSSRPKTKAKALKMALAISYRKKREGE